MGGGISGSQCQQVMIWFGLEHMKSHAVRRFFCSLCDYKVKIFLLSKNLKNVGKVFVVYCF